MGGWLCFGRGTYSEHAGIHTHTRVHKEHWIFILATQGYTLDLPHPDSFTHKSSVIHSLVAPYHVHKPSHLEAAAQTTKSQVPTTIQELTATHSTARRVSHSHGNLRKSHNHEIMLSSCRCEHATAPPTTAHRTHNLRIIYDFTKRFNHTVSGTRGATQSHLDTQSQSRVPSPSCSSYTTHIPTES